MPTKILFCSYCRGANEVDDATPFRPHECEWCHSATWNSPRDPVKPWELTKDDWRFLKTQRIPEPWPEAMDDGA